MRQIRIVALLVATVWLSFGSVLAQGLVVGAKKKDTGDVVETHITLERKPRNEWLSVSAELVYRGVLIDYVRNEDGSLLALNLKPCTKCNDLVFVRTSDDGDICVLSNMNGKIAEFLRSKGATCDASYVWAVKVKGSRVLLQTGSGGEKHYNVWAVVGDSLQFELDPKSLEEIKE